MLTSQHDEVRYVLEQLLAKVDPAGIRHKEEYGLFVFSDVRRPPPSSPAQAQMGLHR